MVLYTNNKGGGKFLTPENKFGAKFFFAPENGPATGNPGSQQAGGAPEATSIDDPFSVIDLDDLDPANRKVIESAKATFAATQKQLAEERKQREYHQQLASRFQSQHDSLKARVDGLNGNNPPGTPPVDPLLAKFTNILISKGVSEDQAKIQAPLMAELLGTYGAELKSELGRDLAPFANSVMMQEATSAWQQATESDRFGALQIPEVATKAWEQVQELVKAGQSVTPATITNLRNMFYMEHLEATGGQPPTTTPVPPTPPPRFPNFGAPSYPGASVTRPPVHDPSAPRYQLDPSTHAALAKVVSNWDVKPKAFNTPKK